MFCRNFVHCFVEAVLVQIFSRSYLSNGRAIVMVVIRLSWMYCYQHVFV